MEERLGSFQGRLESFQARLEKGDNVRALLLEKDLEMHERLNQLEETLPRVPLRPLSYAAR